MIEVNGRRYTAPKQPTVVVCVDGCEPDYIAQAVAAGHMPYLSEYLPRAPRWWPTAWFRASRIPTTCRS
jgi:predicted AlkP superfamily pyrophosphatase or phosphodiesterase